MDGSESTRIATAPAPRRRFRRRLAVAGAAWLVLVGAALGAALLLDDEPARTRSSVAPEGLPPLQLFLDRSPPEEVTDLPDLASQVRRLQDLASSSDDPARWVELGTVAQRLGDLTAAEQSFDRALAVQPNRLDALVGLAMLEGATGPEGLARAARRLSELEAANPESQLVAFNAGMIAVYRADRAGIRRAFARATALGPQTPLGVLARRFAGAAGAPTASS